MNLPETTEQLNALWSLFYDFIVSY